jgi:class 3 adenylate cyclase/tetratricopeptide (TPR) repeat protein
VATCTLCGQENPDEARFCMACAAPLGREAEPAREVRKTVTALFCDVVGSTPLGERLDPEVLRQVMGRYYEEMRTAVERHGGRVDKFIGDAVVAVFGVPLLHEDDALRAVRAADEMRTRLTELNESLREEWDVELDARIGVSTGEIVVGKGDQVLLGDVMNTAARLEQAAGPGEILIGEETHRLIGHAIIAKAAGGRELKGKQTAVPAWRVLSIDPKAEAVAREFNRLLVGREHELGLLRQAFERTVEERCSGLATLLGFPGIGKSRLALGLTGSLTGEARVLVGHCRSYGEGLTYWPVLEMVREAVGESVHSGLVELLDGEPDGARVATLVAAALGEAEAIGEGEETFWALRRVFEALTAVRPLVLVFEDIHWAEPTLLDLIEYLASRVRERPLLLLCLARPELLDARPGWGGGKVNAVSLLLESLSESDARRMLQQRLEGRTIEPEVQARIIQSAQGVPLFLEQMLAMLEEHESISAEDVPPAISALLSARLESLEPGERALLERASVEGERFHAGALADDGRNDVVRRLDGLVYRELIRADEPDVPGEQGFRFAHALIRDAAYARVPKAERATLHEQLADWLEDHDAGEELVGYHLERAFQLSGELAPPDQQTQALARRASGLLAVAGRRAHGHGRGDYTAAVLLLERAANLLPPDDPERVALLPELGFLLGENDVSRSLPLLDEAIQRARAIGDAGVEWESTAIRSRVLLYADPTARPPADVLAEAERATTQLEALDHRRGVASALVVRADVHEMLGQLSNCYELYRRVATLSQGGIRARALGYAGWALCLGNTAADEVEAGCLELLDAAGELRVDRALVLTSVGWVQAMRGRVVEGREACRGSGEVLDEFGTADWVGVAALARGYVELLGANAAAAEREFGRAQEAFAAHGDNWYSTVASVDRALALCTLGHHAEAVRVCAKPGAPYDAEWVTKWNRVQAHAQAARGSPESALAHADTAVRAAEATEYVNYHSAALADRASILDLLDRTADALADLEAALTLYQRKGNVVEAGRISERLAGRA